MIHETAIVKTKDIGENTNVWHWTHIRESAKIGDHCNIGQCCYIDQNVVIGDRVKIQNGVNIYDGVIIEDDVFIGPGVTFTNDPYPRADKWCKEQIKKTVVMKGASIGANATILCGVTIGKFAMIGQEPL